MDGQKEILGTWISENESVSVFVIYQIQTESSVIGALYALGVKKKNLIHYITLPTSTQFIGGLIGAAFGFLGNSQLSDSYTYFSIPLTNKIYPQFTDTVKYTITPVTHYILDPALTAGSFQVTVGDIDDYTNGVLTITNVTGNVTVGLAPGVTSVVSPEEYDSGEELLNNVKILADQNYVNENIILDDSITWTNKSGTEAEITGFIFILREV